MLLVHNYIYHNTDIFEKKEYFLFDWVVAKHHKFDAYIYHKFDVIYQIKCSTIEMTKGLCIEKLTSVLIFASK